jgi:carboxyl-terminal processing protease
MNPMQQSKHSSRRSLWIALGCCGALLACAAFACAAYAVIALSGGLQGLTSARTGAQPATRDPVASIETPHATAPSTSTDRPQAESATVFAPRNRERNPQPVPPVSTVDAAHPKGDADAQQAVIDEAFELIRTTYVFTDYNGLDLDGEQRRISALVASGAGDAQVYAEMANLIERLDDRHSVFMTPAEVKEDEERQTRTGGFQGIGVVTDVDRDARYLVVLYVYATSPAADAGIKPHDRILTIDGAPSVDAAGKSQVLKLRGKAGTVVNVELQSPGGKARVLPITRGLVVRDLPVQARVLPGPKKIGYLRVPTLAEDAVYKDLRAALRTMMADNGDALDGIVLDLRNNAGGSYLNAIALLGHFVPDGSYGTLIKRGEPDEPFEVNALTYGNSDTVPLIVLTNYNTISFSEIVAGVIQRSGRGRVIGQRTRGNIELVRVNDLRDGSRLLLAEQTYRPAAGANWEGVGLQPDVDIDVDWENMTSEDDPMLKAAIAELSR